MKPRAIDNWIRMNSSLAFHKYTAFASLCLSLVLAAVVFLQANQNPIVVIDKGGARVHTVGDRGGYELTEGDVEGFIASYVENRYTWTGFAPKKIVESLSCTTTEGFRKKLETALGDAKHQNKDGETVEQYAAFVKPRLKDDRSFASFDRILRINAIPLASPQEIALDIVQGARTDCNPVGLYVNGVTEYER